MEEYVNIRKTLKKTFEDGRRRRRQEYMSQEDKVRIFGESVRPQSEEAARLPPRAPGLWLGSGVSPRLVSQRYSWNVKTLQISLFGIVPHSFQLGCGLVFKPKQTGNPSLYESKRMARVDKNNSIVGWACSCLVQCGGQRSRTGAWNDRVPDCLSQSWFCSLF